VVGYFWHAVQVWALRVLPMSVTYRIVAPIMKARWKDEKRKM